MGLGDHLGFLGVVLALVGIAIAVLWPTRKWIGWTCLGLAAIVLVLWGINWFRVGEVEPNLQATLIVDAAHQKRVDGHFEIGNEALPVTLTSLSIFTEKSVETHPIPSTRVPAHARISQSIPPNVIVANEYQNLNLSLRYSTDDGKSFVSSYRYFITPASLSAKSVIYPDQITTASGVLSNQEDILKILPALNESVGTVFLVLDEKVNGKFNGVKLMATNYLTHLSLVRF
jgi:hypothetical protein